MKKKMAIDKNFEQDLKKFIDDADVISFDIFDTLLLRYYLNPTDLFLHIEKAKNISGFYEARILAEKNARIKNSGLEDITLDLIYNEISADYKDCQNTELEFEKAALHLNWQIKPIFEYAKKKTIVITSDMYLPTPFLKDILEKNGFCGFDNIFVSGELGKTKYSGSLFLHILEKYKIPRNKLFHIGDNKKSDYKVPKKMGIKCFHYQKISEQITSQSRRLKKFSKGRRNSLGASILTSFMGERILQKNISNYWNELGYSYAGPIAYSYVKYLDAIASEKGITNLLFVARDGYILQKVYNFLGGKIKNSYVYMPRIFRHIYDLNCANNPPSGKITNSNCNQNDGLENFQKYISKYVDKNDTIGLVDTITKEFSSQYLLSKMVENDITGFYWSNISLPTYPFKFSTYKENVNLGTLNTEAFTLNWDFIEFLISSNELSVKSLNKDGTPAYSKCPPKEEIFRASLYSEISEGALNFVKDLSLIFDKTNIFISADDIIEYVNLFVLFPTKLDKNFMSEVSYAPSFDHESYYPLFSRKIKLSEFLKNPFKSIKFLRYCKWRSPLQSLLINATKPISIRIRKKYIKITLFPYSNFISRLKFQKKFNRK